VKIILFANTEWYLFNFRLSLAKALKARLLRPVVRGLMRLVLNGRGAARAIERPTRLEKPALQ
jgi:hypothetical protein